MKRTPRHTTTRQSPPAHPKEVPEKWKVGVGMFAAYGGQNPQNQHRHEVNKLNVKKSGGSRKQ